MPSISLPPFAACHGPTRLGVALLLLTLAGLAPTASASADETQPAAESGPSDQPSQGDAGGEPSKFKKFAEVVKHAKHLPGLLDLYHDDQHLYAALTPADFDKSLLAPMAVAAGAGAAGTAFNFDEQWIVAFRRTGDRVQLVRKNVRYTAPADSPLAKAVAQGYRDSVLMTLAVVSDDAPHDAVLVDLSEVFFGNFANFSTGSIDRSKSRWFAVKVFPKNLELQVEATFDGSPVPAGSGTNGDTGYVDSRGVTLVLHYSLVELPPAGYRPRLADPRIGHFVSAVKNFDSPDPDSLFVRRINRWRLEKADPQAKLSPPKQQLVWWIEDTVPLAYRPYVEAGILEWNKAFERIGFQNAIAVRWQGEQDDFDPEDVNFCTFRWITSPYGYAMSNLRSNPATGEIVDADIIFDSSWIRYWQRERAYLIGADEAGGDESAILGVGEIVSPMMAAQYAADLSATALGAPSRERLRAGNPAAATIATGNSPPSACRYAATLESQLAAGRALLPGGELPPEALGQIIKAVVMHETGHSLGLRHNFRGSCFHPCDELHDVQLTRRQGLLSSVMDYAPLNIAPRGQVQGDYAATTLGPYDYWAIEYAYKEVAPEDEAAELQRIAARSVEPDLAFASDEDYSAAHDPRTNQYDLGADPLEFARERLALAADGLQGIEDRLVRNGESWSRLRPAVVALWRQYGDAAFLAARFVGGRQLSHDARGDSAHEPLAPVPPSQQRAALEFLAQQILIEEPVPRRPDLLRRMSTDQWTHWGVDTRSYEGKVGISYYDFVQAIQEVAFAELLGSGSRLRRIETNLAMSDDADNPLQLAEVFQTFYDAAWGATFAAIESGAAAPSSQVMRGLQQLHIRYLTEILANETRAKSPALAFAHFSGERGEYPEDARSLALADLMTLRALLQRVVNVDEPLADATTAAHLQACLYNIEQALDER
ncbi:MAG: zinc-dependent metalloprotease [Planctomycetales bacterium]|nr:zinc-dependent metalloprotease [Planctomycetales bacterium]